MFVFMSNKRWKLILLIDLLWSNYKALHNHLSSPTPHFSILLESPLLTCFITTLFGRRDNTKTKLPFDAYMQKKNFVILIHDKLLLCLWKYINICNTWSCTVTDFLKLSLVNDRHVRYTKLILLEIKSINRASQTFTD